MSRLGWKLAMRVLQSDLYHELDDAERAECDELVRKNLFVALSESAIDRKRILEAFIREKCAQDGNSLIVSVTAGKAIIDFEDLGKVIGTTWFMNKAGYVTGARYGNGKKISISMHREIMGLQIGDRRVVDHINGVRNDNRKSNLRICTNAENQRNRGKNKNNTSGFKGVTFHKLSGLWKAMIKVDGKDIFLGYYKKPEEAHQAYCAGATEYHGEFAKN